MRHTTLPIITLAILLICIKTQDETPPDTWQEHWFEHNQLLKLQNYDDNVALYYDDDMDPSITWPLDISSQIWAYTKTTYGDFGGQQRLYVVLHQNKYGGGHPSTFFDDSHDYRNTIDVGQSGDNSWADANGWSLAAITHEISHIVELASKGVHNSPAFGIWHDSKWAEIFIYDVYTKLGWTDQADQWKSDRASTTDDFPRAGTQWFNNWFFPIYSQYGETSVLNNYFELLSNNFPKSPFNDTSPYFQYDRDMNLGEFVHFWSGAAQTNLQELALNAFGDKDEQGNDWQGQLTQAQSDFSGITYQ